MVTLTHWVCFLCVLWDLPICYGPRLSVVFRLVVFWVVYLHAGDRQMWPEIQKGPPSSSVANYRPISVTSVLSKVFERLVSVRLGRFMERCGVVPTTQFAYRKGLGTANALLCVSHTLKNALESGQEARMVQIDFSAAFARVNHQGILSKLCSVGTGGYVLSILREFISNWSQPVMLDGCWSKLVYVVSWASYDSVFGPLLFLLYTSELFWPLRGIFARFPEQILKDLVSCGSPGKYSMIDRFLIDAFGVLSGRFMSIV